MYNSNLQLKALALFKQTDKHPTSITLTLKSIFFPTCWLKHNFIMAHSEAQNEHLATFILNTMFLSLNITYNNLYKRPISTQINISLPCLFIW